MRVFGPEEGGGVKDGSSKGASDALDRGANNVTYSPSQAWTECQQYVVISKRNYSSVLLGHTTN